MKFSELMSRVAARGVKVAELRVGGDPEIGGVAEDSRRVKAGDLFVARGGTKTSGAKFVADAVGRGAVAAVIESESPGIAIPGLDGAKFSDDRMASAQVADANLACAILAHEVAGNPTGGMKVIGITGTKGKTTVAYLLRSVLKAAGFKVGMIGTVEIDDGERATPAEMTTPGSVELVELFSRMKANGVTHCVMEVSSHALHQHRVAGIDFAVAIFTNLTGDHLDYHKTMEEYAAAKAILFEGLSLTATAILNANDVWVEKIAQSCKAKVVRCHVEIDKSGKGGLNCAPRSENGWSGLIKRMGADGMIINLEGPITRIAATGKELPYMYQLFSPLVGKHNAYNITSTFAAAHALFDRDDQQSMLQVCRALLKETGAPGRLQPVLREGVRRDDMPFQVFVDYAHTHDALENVLGALRATMGSGSSGPSAGDPPKGGTPRGKLICVFGCGGDRDRTKRPKMGAVAEKLADRVIVTSDNPRTEDAGGIIEEICAGFSAGWKDAGKISVEADRRAAIRAAIGAAAPGDVVLIAGKGHENYQIIGTTKHHFDDVEEAEAALAERFIEPPRHQGTKTK